LCAGYRAFFNYVDQPMKQMAALLNMQRPPADIMKTIGAEPTLREAPAGSACPCGSGKPVEQCHRAPGGFIPPHHSVPPPSKIQNKRNRH
jgi:uncharacterized protein